MIDIFMKNEILLLHRNGRKIKEIERDLNISRNTVRKYTREFDSTKKLIEETVSV